MFRVETIDVDAMISIIVEGVITEVVPDHCLVQEVDHGQDLILDPEVVHQDLDLYQDL